MEGGMEPGRQGRGSVEGGKGGRRQEEARREEAEREGRKEGEQTSVGISAETL